MQSTLKKDYQKETLPDGSVKISFRESLIGGPTPLATLFGLALFAGVIVGGFLLSVLFYVVTTSLLVSFILGFASILGLVYFVCAKLPIFFKDTYIIVKREGLVFPKHIVHPNDSGMTVMTKGQHQIPFSVIDNVFMKDLTVAKDAAYLFLRAEGQDIKMTRYLTHALAQKVFKEIIDSKAELQQQSALAT